MDDNTNLEKQIIEIGNVIIQLEQDVELLKNELNKSGIFNFIKKLFICYK